MRSCCPRNRRLFVRFSLPRAYCEHFVFLPQDNPAHACIRIMYDSECHVLIETPAFLVSHPEDLFFSFIHVKLRERNQYYTTAFTLYLPCVCACH
jgi:hypothetical protein